MVYYKYNLAKRNDKFYILSNDLIDMGKVKVLCAGVLLGEVDKKRLEPSHQFYSSFGSVFKNKVELTKEDVYCIVDEVSQTNEFTSGYSDLPMFIAKDLTVKGTATFIVPKNATSYDIRYGDYITVHIEK